MEISQHALTQFVVVAEEEHIGRAAQRLSMTQPPLTQAIQRLERTVGVTLLERSRRGVRLTPAGRSFATDARHLLDAQQGAIRRARRIAEGTQGELAVGYSPGLAQQVVPQLLRVVRRELPNLRVHVTQQMSADIAVAVRAGSLDIGLARAPVPDHSGLDVHSLPPERLAAAVPAAHRWAERTHMPLSDLRSERFAILSPRSGDLSEQMHSACRHAGFTPTVAAYADALPGLYGHVTAGDCVALVPHTSAVQPPPGVTVIPLDDDDPSLILHSAMVTRTGTTDLMVTRLVALCREHLNVAPGVADSDSGTGAHRP